MSRIDKIAFAVTVSCPAVLTSGQEVKRQAEVKAIILSHIKAGDIAEWLCSCRYGLVEQVNDGDGTSYCTQEPSQREQAIAALTAAIQSYLDGGE